MIIVDYINKIKFKLLSKTKQEEVLRHQWFREHVSIRAPSVNTKYSKFKHIIPIDYYKCHVDEGPHVSLVEDLKIYMYPNRSLDDCTIFTLERGYWDNYNNDFIFNEFGGGDQSFAITNNSRDAIMISLKYC